MITARDIGLIPTPFVAPSATSSGSQYVTRARTPFRERLLRFVLFVAVLTSSVAFIEPSPHDALVGLLALCCLVAGVRFERLLALPFILLLIMNVGGLSAYVNAIGQDGTLQYVATSLYLAVAAMLFASLFSAPDPRRLELMRSAYVITAVIAALLGTVAYFRIPGSGLFLVEERAAGMFKDPNVFGPFLIWPALALLERLMLHRVRMLDLAALLILLVGLMLSFSRGAWLHLVMSALLLIAVAILTATEQRLRFRIVALTGLSTAVVLAGLVVLMSIPSVAAMLSERAHLFNSYDVGSSGRFTLQQLALSAVLDYPNGMGPLEFGRINGLQQHNVYLQAFLVYGWVGAMAYFLLLGATMFVGLRAGFRRTPFQPYLLTATAAFFGEMAEGFIIDTDHWRHFFLLIGIIWGAAAAASKYGDAHRLPINS